MARSSSAFCLANRRSSFGALLAGSASRSKASILVAIFSFKALVQRHLCDAASLNSYGLFVLERLLPADRSCERADRKDQCSNLLSLFIFISMALVYLRFFCAGVFILLRCLLVGKRRQPIHEFTRGCSKCEQLKATESKSVAAR